jgi:HPt (histidine-containing phosphotransfer) domain-containing protein
MEIKQIMKRLDSERNAEAEGIKTAADNGTTPVSGDALRQALRDTLATADSEKTAAAAATPQGDLLKMAEDISAAEQEAMSKMAQVYGAAMCDGFMARFASYEEAAGTVAPPEPAKIAAAPAEPAAPTGHDEAVEMIKAASDDPEFQKFASENPELIKEAVDLGYQKTMADLVKQAEDEFTQGYDETMEEVHKLASAAYSAGATHINQAIQQLQQQQQPAA